MPFLRFFRRDKQPSVNRGDAAPRVIIPSGVIVYSREVQIAGRMAGE